MARVLLIEDSKYVASVLTQMLLAHGAEVEVAGTIIEVQAYFPCLHSFDLIALDGQLPDGPTTQLVDTIGRLFDGDMVAISENESHQAELHQPGRCNHAAPKDQAAHTLLALVAK